MLKWHEYSVVRRLFNLVLRLSPLCTRTLIKLHVVNLPSMNKPDNILGQKEYCTRIDKIMHVYVLVVERWDGVICVIGELCRNYRSR